MKIGERKARLAPIIKELRPLRQRAQEMQSEHDERKRYVFKCVLRVYPNWFIYCNLPLYKPNECHLFLCKFLGNMTPCNYN